MSAHNQEVVVSGDQGSFDAVTRGAGLGSEQYAVGGARGAESGSVAVAQVAAFLPESVPATNELGAAVAAQVMWRATGRL
jgi:hypothetical protein